MCGYPIAEVGVGPRVEINVWDGLVGVSRTQQQGAVDQTWISESPTSAVCTHAKQKVSRFDCLTWGERTQAVSFMCAIVLF